MIKRTGSMKSAAKPLMQGSLFVTSRGILRDMRNYLAGQLVGLTRDDVIVEEVLKCAFCRVAFKTDDTRKLFREEQIGERYRRVFHSIRHEYPEIFAADDEIELGDPFIAYIDQQLNAIIESNTTHDLIGDIYETFIGSNFRGQEGQFFTPKEAVQAIVELTDPRVEDIIIDPACGSGSFLLAATQRIISSAGQVAPERIHGVDKDSYLARLAQLHLSIQYQQQFPIHCADSLTWNDDNLCSSSTGDLVGQYSLVLTNPPFGAKIVALTGAARRDYALAHKWRFSKRIEKYCQTTEMATNPSPQVLFIERALTLLADGGRLGIILPESILSNPNHRYVTQYILDNAKPLAIIGMPEALFKTSGRGGTHTKVCLVILEKSMTQSDHVVFMAEARWCGHDSRAREIPRNDLPEILRNYDHFRKGREIADDELGFRVPFPSIRNNILAPRFYIPTSKKLLATLSRTHHLYRFGDLVRDGAISLSTGDEVGKLAYGDGDIPFVRTSDISNWEIKVDPKHLVSRQTYLRYAAKQDVREGDLLMVRDGTYLIGTCAYISKYDVNMVYQSHIYKIRVHPNALLDNYLLLAVLSSSPVISQIKAMSFTQDIIDTLGDRIQDIILPIPRNLARRQDISEMVRQSIESRVASREIGRLARLAVIDAESVAYVAESPGSSGV